METIYFCDHKSSTNGPFSIAMLNSQKVSGMIVSITIDCPQQCWTMLLDVFSQMIFILKTDYFFHFHICLPGGDKLSTSAINFKWRLFSIQPYLTHFWYLLVISCDGFASYHTAVVGLDDIFNQLELQPYRFKKLSAGTSMSTNHANM